MYAFKAREFTTTSMSPSDIHQVGMNEVRRIRSEMEAIIKQTNFKGSFREFLEFLRKDKQFYYATPEELLEAYRATAKKIDPELVKLFRRLPRIPYGVEPIPMHLAPDTTTAYYSRPELKEFESQLKAVVDTGMHEKQWTRQQAIDFFADNTAKTLLDIENEIDRYISWPGQALAYKIGELKIKELRARSEKELGAKFDIRDFHDQVLIQGAVPLDVLEAHMDQWISGKK